jgi:C4-type Zn-finger protein
MKTCPTCWSVQIERTHRTPFERFLSRFGIFPFICNECGNRFRGRFSLENKEPDRQI